MIFLSKVYRGRLLKAGTHVVGAHRNRRVSFIDNATHDDEAMNLPLEADILNLISRS